MGRVDRFRYVRLAGFGEDEYELYRLGERSREDARRYLSAAEAHNVVRPALNDHRYTITLEDKWLFARVFDRAGLSTPRTLGVLHPTSGATWAGGPLRTGAELAAAIEADRAGELVIKPVAGFQGKQLLMVEVERRGEGVGLRLDGRSLSPQDMVDSLPTEGFYGLSGFVVQERLRPHPAIAELNPGALNTLRIHTLVRGDGSVRLHSAVLRLGRQGQRLEGIGTGAVAVLVADPEQGILGEGVLRPAFGGGRFSSHPDTGVPFTGRKLPCWESVLDLCERAARVVPAVRAVGWDVALTPAGPALVEGNADWNPRNAQSHGRGYLSDEIRHELAAAGARRPEAEPDLVTLARRVRRRLGRIAIRRIFRWSGLHPHADRRL